MSQTLENNTALITGGLGDIGRAIALELGGRGAAVAVGDVRASEDANDFLRELEGLGIRALYDYVDVADATAVGTWLDTVSENLGTPDLIIPNAAIVTLKDVNEISPEEWAREIAIDLNGAFYTAQAAATRLLKEGKEGRIVFIGSWAADRPHPHIPAYSAAKAGLRMLMQCMALQWAPSILVNEVAPGYVDAGLSGRIFDEQPEVKEQAKRQVPNQILIDPQDVAWQVAHLCDPQNRHMTGSVLTMDGGLSLKGTITA